MNKHHFQYSHWDSQLNSTMLFLFSKQRDFWRQHNVLLQSMSFKDRQNRVPVTALQIVNECTLQKLLNFRKLHFPPL